MVEDVRLPRAAISFYQPCMSSGAFADLHFTSLGRNSNDIISMDQDGNTVLYDAAARAVRVMPAPHAPKHSPVSVTVGDGLYLLDRNPEIEYHPFEALVHNGIDNPYEEKWYWRSLPLPPYAKDDDEDRSAEDKEKNGRQCYQMSGINPYGIRAYTVVGDSQIWISTVGGGTFSFDTTCSVWSKAGDWALPFYGPAEYAPEHGLWFGFSSQGRHFVASDLNAVSATRPPVVVQEWDELAQPLPKQWVPIMAYLLPLGSGKFYIARIFDMAEEGWCLLKQGMDYKCVDTFVVFTGVEVHRASRGVLKMIKHKSRRYSLDCLMAELL